MQHEFILALQNACINGQLNTVFSASQMLFVHEIKAVTVNNRPFDRTELSEVQPELRHFKIINNNQLTVAHVCVDGDFIPYGTEKYNFNSESYSDGRPDSIVFTENTLIFLELKLNQDNATWTKEDRAKWKSFFDGLAQIQDFVRFLRDNNIQINHYFQKLEAVVCMRFKPGPPNTQRNTELIRRALDLGFRIAPPHQHDSDYFL